MRDNPPHDGEKGATNNKPGPPSAATPSPTRKRLLGDPKPKDDSATASRESALSSDSSSDRFRKKIREFPNLSDCHSCGVRINTTNPKDRLQTLESVWRIVLLCKKCIKRAESAEICPYCFSEASEEDCFRCRDCKRRIHKDCVVKYGESAPWSYSCSELRFSVCIDCWVPKLLVDSVRIRRRGRNKKTASKSCSVGDSRVLVNSNGLKLLEDVVKDASSVVQKKVEVAAKAKENALRKAVVAKRASELASNALDLVAKKDENGAKSECLVTSSNSITTTETTVVDDAELAFQLHRAMNSSPRISKNLCSVNSSCLAVQKLRDLNGNLSDRSSDSRGSDITGNCGKIEVCTNSKLIEKPDEVVFGPSVCFQAIDSGSCSDLGKLGLEKIADTRTSLKDKECQENSEVSLAVDPVGNCSSAGDNRMDSEYQSCQEQDKSSHELLRSDMITRCLPKCDANNTMLLDRSCNRKPDRYLLKYSKRGTSLKVVSNHKAEFRYDAFRLENQASATGLPLNCSKESRTFSDAPFQSCAVSMQAFACVSGLSREQP